jgi:2-iminobutanoate/2-iminopropanoate deaminase
MKALVRAMPVLAVLGLTACMPTPTSTVYLHADQPMGPYSASVLSGDLCFVSGTVGAERADFESEASSALGAMERELGRAGLTLADLVHVVVYVTDMGNYEAFNKIYAAHMPEPYPARTMVEVGARPGGARVEVQGTARKR